MDQSRARLDLPQKCCKWRFFSIALTKKTFHLGDPQVRDRCWHPNGVPVKPTPKTLQIHIFLVLPWNRKKCLSFWWFPSRGYITVNIHMGSRSDSPPKCCKLRCLYKHWFTIPLPTCLRCKSPWVLGEEAFDPYWPRLDFLHGERTKTVINIDIYKKVRAQKPSWVARSSKSFARFLFVDPISISRLSVARLSCKAKETHPVYVSVSLMKSNMICSFIYFPNIGMVCFEHI